MSLAFCADAELISELRRRGYHLPLVSFRWERPCKFSRRHKKHPTYFSKRMRLLPAPPPFDADRGKTGRIVRLRSNPELEAWMKGR